MEVFYTWIGGFDELMNQKPGDAPKHRMPDTEKIYSIVKNYNYIIKGIFVGHGEVWIKDSWDIV